jgi:hypothetical protein
MKAISLWGFEISDRRGGRDPDKRNRLISSVNHLFGFGSPNMRGDDVSHATRAAQ